MIFLLRVIRPDLVYCNGVTGPRSLENSCTMRCTDKKRGMIDHSRTYYDSSRVLHRSFIVIQRQVRCHRFREDAKGYIRYKVTSKLICSLSAKASHYSASTFFFELRTISWNQVGKPLSAEITL